MLRRLRAHARPVLSVERYVQIRVLEDENHRLQAEAQAADLQVSPRMPLVPL